VSEADERYAFVDFDTVLNVLQGWLGETVEVTVEVGDLFPVARMRGVLAGADGIAVPEHDGDFAFAVGGEASLVLRRELVPESRVWPYSGRLAIELIHEAATADSLSENVAATLVLSGPALGAPPAP
jgi:hypothetical protein